MTTRQNSQRTKTPLAAKIKFTVNVIGVEATRISAIGEFVHEVDMIDYKGPW
jgi:hypothetical protein